MALNSRQARFVEEYLVSLNATDAARLAGYAHPNAQGPRLLVNGSVQAAVAAGQAARTQRTQVTQDWVVRRLREEAESAGEGSSHSARVRALELLGRHVGMWPARLQVEGALAVEIVETVVSTRVEAKAALSAVAGAG